MFNPQNLMNQGGPPGTMQNPQNLDFLSNLGNLGGQSGNFNPVGGTGFVGSNVPIKKNPVDQKPIFKQPSEEKKNENEVPNFEEQFINKQKSEPKQNVIPPIQNVKKYQQELEQAKQLLPDLDEDTLIEALDNFNGDVGMVVNSLLG
jgi:hypothetical protein